jgi:hypothetical protein
LSFFVLAFVFVLIGAFLFAKLEIEIEGKDGWAASLPTWRVERHKLLDLFFGGRPLTGYHVWAFLLIFFLMHQPFFWGLPFSWRSEARIVGAYFIFWIAEDLLWFVLNPHYGWKKFTREHVWWHKRWALGVPVDYWVFGSAALLLVALP